VNFGVSFEAHEHTAHAIAAVKETMQICSWKSLYQTGFCRLRGINEAHLVVCLRSLCKAWTGRSIDDAFCVDKASERDVLWKIFQSVVYLAKRHFTIGL